MIELGSYLICVDADRHPTEDGRPTSGRATYSGLLFHVSAQMLIHGDTQHPTRIDNMYKRRGHVLLQDGEGMWSVHIFRYKDSE